MRLKGKTAIVTGGGRGIGQSIALALAAEGCSVAVTGRTESTLEPVAEQIRQKGADAMAVVCDIADPVSVGALFAKVKERWKKLDILVNNAGESHSDPIAKVSLDTWNRMIAVNLTGTFLCSQQALQMMLPVKSGRIVNIASTAAKIPFRYAGAYVAAKHGVLGLTRSMAIETATSGITVNAICPGWVDTDMAAKAVGIISTKTKVTSDKAREMLEADCPQKRIIQPEEIAFATVWLACDEARGITGQGINVDGGQAMF